jgi:hypothetical protein
MGLLVLLATGLVRRLLAREVLGDAALDLPGIGELPLLRYPSTASLRPPGSSVLRPARLPSVKVLVALGVSLLLVTLVPLLLLADMEVPVARPLFRAILRRRSGEAMLAAEALLGSDREYQGLPGTEGPGCWLDPSRLQQGTGVGVFIVDKHSWSIHCHT